MTLVTFAVPFESAAFRQLAISRTVRILHTGVGSDAVRATLEPILCAEVPGRVIASGFAGALVAGLTIGEIVGDATHLVSAPAVLATAAAKQEFRQRTGAAAVDMETDTIRELCRTVGVPCTVLRAISDGADDDLGLPPEFLDELSRRPVRATPRLAWTLLTDGERRRAFLRLVRDCRTAQRALAGALAAKLATP